MDRSHETRGAGALFPRMNRRQFAAAGAASFAAHPTITQSTPGTNAQEIGAGAVVSSHWLATNVGIDVLNAGGTAADAAIAVAAVLTVVEPYFSSALGGGTWALYYEAESGEVTSMDGVGPVGSLATLEDYLERANEPGMHQANVPGSWDGWMLWLDRYGRLDLGEILEPAITLARDGFPVSGQMASFLERNEEMIADFPDTASTYLIDGVFPANGDTIHLPDLASTLQTLSDAYEEAEGERSARVQAARDYYYRGPIAEAVVAFSEENGGYYTLDDFAKFAAEIVTPVSINYRGVDVYQNPPNSQGIAMLLALNTLKFFDLSNVEPMSADTIHVQVEAIKLAFADRYALVGDPSFVEVSLEELLSDEYGRA